MILIEKLRDQRKALLRQGVPLSFLEIQATRKARDVIVREMRRYHIDQILSQPEEVKTLDGIPIRIIPGMLETALLWAPHQGVEVRQMPGGGREVYIYDADPRVLHEKEVCFKEMRVKFEPLDTTPRWNRRLNITGEVKVIEPTSL